jgi:hypothetical protein
MNPPPEQAEHANRLWDMLHLPSHWPAQTDLLQWCQTMGPGEAAILVIGGIIYLLYGYQIFRALVIVNAGLCGAYIGARVGEKAGSMYAGALIGGFITAALAWPLLKYAVALMGGIFGALLGASMWRAVGLDPGMGWAGALIGLVAFGMLSFILFRASVMMYMSLQGSVMLIFGILGLVFKYKDLAPTVAEHMTLKPFMLPMAIFIPTVLGWIYQQHQHGEPQAIHGKK